MFGSIILTQLARESHLPGQADECLKKIPAARPRRRLSFAQRTVRD